jgi:hypothetical protein
VKLFTFQQIISPHNKKSKKSNNNGTGLQRLQNDASRIGYSLFHLSSNGTNGWKKQSTILKAQVGKSHCAVQWLMCQVARVAPRPKGMGNNNIKTRLVLHLSEDILDHGVSDTVNSAYAESAHIPHQR